MSNGWVSIECSVCGQKVYLGKYYINRFTICNPNSAIEKFLQEHCMEQQCDITNTCDVENLKLHLDE